MIGDENEGGSIHVDQGDIVYIRSWNSVMQNVKTHSLMGKKTSYGEVKSVYDSKLRFVWCFRGRGRA